MKRAAQGIFLALAIASTAAAGHVYGTIREANSQPVRGARVTLHCGGEVGSGPTDNEGNYRLFAKATGSCTLEIDAGGRRATGSLYSYDRPTGYDFDLIPQGNGWVLRRR